MSAVTSSPDQLLPLLDTCLPADRARLRKRIGGLQRARKAGRDISKPLTEVEQAVQQARGRRDQRAARVPTPEYDAALPVCAKRDEIAEAIAEHPVVIVAGATGSGKTTQLPKICLELGRGVDGLIGCTQPRRIAAISVANRVAEELKTELGGVVGYKTRFGAKHSPDNLVRFMTDGILLAETQGDRKLLAYDTLIIDEAHERSLNIDLLLGYLKQLLPRRPDLKVVVSSATLDTERFSTFFDNAPVIEVEGRTFPVEVRYDPPGDDQDLAEAVADAVESITRRDRSGDVLVFFSGERDIRDAAEALGKRKLDHSEVLPLFGRLSQAEQQRVFRSLNKQKVVLATNVAETSLTIPGIRYVVDTGLARIHRYSHRSQVSHLQIEPVSQASCNQRTGRCGRVGPGICVRLFDQDDFEQRPEFTDPEIRRSSLAEVILRMQSLGLTAVEEFPFIDPPPPKAINEGYRVLDELGALDPKRHLSDIGRQLARLPLDPRLGRMVIAGNALGCLEEVLVITAALSIQDPRERPLEKQQAADEKHRAYRDDQSDFVSLLKLWQAFMEKLAERPSRSAQRRWCRQNFLSYMRMLEWRDTHQQVEDLANSLGFRTSNGAADYAVLHQALMTGLLGRLGLFQPAPDKKKGGHYLGARQIQFLPFPGSSLFKKKPKWVMAGELVATSRLYGRTLARIEPEWIEPLAEHLVRRSHGDPHWEKRQGRVMAFEQVTLFGLPIVTRRKVDYGRIDPVLSRELFIRHGLVEGELHTRAPFLAHNRELVSDIEALEQRSRRRDILVDDEVLFGFYDQRLPAELCDARRFERWRKRAESDDKRLLFMDRDALMQHAAEDITAEQFPDSVELDGGALHLDYQFEPGREHDGVSVSLPLARLAQLQRDPFEWLVPGLRAELFEHLLRALPKALRKNFVPVPDFARAAVAALSPDDGPLLVALSRHLQRLTGVEVPLAAWNTERLPLHLQMNFQVVDRDGREVASGRDLDQLQEQLAEKAEQGFRDVPQGRWQRDRVDGWDFGELPEQVHVGKGRHAALGYPALVDQGDHVGLGLFHEPQQAQVKQRAGLRRLFALALGSAGRQVAKGLPIDAATTLAYARFGSSADLRRTLLDATVERLFLAEGDVRDPEAFRRRLEARKPKVAATARKLWERVAPLLVQRQRIAAAVESLHQRVTANAAADLRTQLEWLFPPGFLIELDDARLSHYPRYLKAIERRLEKLATQPGRDQERLDQIARYRDAVLERHPDPGTSITDPELQTLRWMVEELRVSLFAQDLGTAVPVSAKRLQRQLDQLA